MPRTKPTSQLLFDYRPDPGAAPSAAQSDEDPTQPDSVPLVYFLKLVLPHALGRALVDRAAYAAHTARTRLSPERWLGELVQRLDTYGGMDPREVAAMDAHARTMRAENRLEFLFMLARERQEQLAGKTTDRFERTPAMATWSGR